MRITYIITLLTALTLQTRAQYQGAGFPLNYYHLVLKITPDTFERDSQPYSTFNSDGPYGFIANTSVSDSAGNLLLYSFGEDIRNKYGNIIEGGEHIAYLVDYPDDTSSNNASDPHSQGALLLPRPSYTSQYYLFNKDMDSFFNGQPLRVTATLVDISANNDSGKVLRAYQIVINDMILSDARMTACQHANGRDWWLVNHQYLTNKIYTNLITPDSIYGPFEQDIGLPGLEPDLAGWSIFSPDGKTFATATEGMGAITLLDFDRCNGSFSNFRAINTLLEDSGNYFELAFSPSNRFLYAANARFLEQYDLQAMDIEASRVQLIHDTAGYPLLGEMVLMPDGKIYQVGWTDEDSTLSVIDSPDIKGLGCNFHLRSLVVPNSLQIAMVPNLPTYNLGPVIGSACDTLSTNIANIADTKQHIQIYPNPATDVVNITTNLNAGEAGIVTVFNVEGIKVKEMKVAGGTTTNILQTGNLANGVYLYYLNTSQQYNARGKIVITK